MKTLLTIMLALTLSTVSYSQEKNIETESVKLDNLITFIVEQYSTQNDSTETKNITFLIETYADNFNTEDKIILKQAFKLLSKRLTQDDLISITTYSHFNGLAVNQVVANDIKRLLYVIEHLKLSIAAFEKDGIELAYDLTKANYVEGSENSVVMVRLPNRKSEPIPNNIVDKKKTSKSSSNAVVLTAIALLPEIISIIKD